MEHMKVAELIEALNLVGRVYRSRDGSKPADAVAKVIQQLKGNEALTLDLWAQKSRNAAKPKSRKTTSVDTAKIAGIVEFLVEIQSQWALRAEISELKLSVAEWKILAKTVSGKSARTGKIAKELVETHFSDKLLLEERVSNVKRLFGSTA